MIQQLLQVCKLHIWDVLFNYNCSALFNICIRSHVAAQYYFSFSIFKEHVMKLYTCVPLSISSFLEVKQGIQCYKYKIIVQRLEKSDIL